MNVGPFLFHFEAEGGAFVRSLFTYRAEVSHPFVRFSFWEFIMTDISTPKAKGPVYGTPQRDVGLVGFLAHQTHSDPACRWDCGAQGGPRRSRSGRGRW